MLLISQYKFYLFYVKKSEVEIQRDGEISVADLALDIHNRAWLNQTKENTVQLRTPMWVALTQALVL